LSANGNANATGQLPTSRQTEPDGEPILEASGLYYSYLDRYPALTDVSVTVRRGERVALLGANGCGKSTLLKVLDGLLFPSKGSYTAFGHEVTEDSMEDVQMSEGFRSRVGFVFQNSDAQVFSPTVREEIAFGPLQLGFSREDTAGRVEDVTRMLGITDLLDRAPYQLSGGQKKKVAIATVLVMGPEVLLFDEPTAALDPRTQYWLMDLIEQLSDTGKTIVHATHDLDLLPRIADRAVVFGEDHRVAATGTPDEVLADHDLLVGVNLVHPESLARRP
jgi:cobalt/nickel transport system ATP-binding protein